MTISARLRSVSLAVAGGALLLSFSMASSTRAAAGPHVVFDATIGRCFIAQGPSNANYTLNWRSATGHLKSSWGDATSDGGYLVPPQAACNAARLAVGDTLRVTFTDLGYTRTFSVPTLTMAIDRSTSVASGLAPAGTELQLRVTRADPGDDYPAMACTTTALTNSNGAWKRALQNVNGGPACSPGYRTRGRDAFTAWFTNGSGDTLHRSVTAPYVELRLGSSVVSGAVDSGANVTIRETTDTGAVRGTASARGNLEGSFAATLRSSTSSTVAVRPGDRFTGNWAGTVSFDVPNVTISWSSTNGTLSGRCMPNARFGLWVRFHEGGGAGRVGTTGPAGGTGAIDLSGNPLGPGDVVTLTCERGLGDEVSRSKTF
jgi:hypothetical protein